MTFRSFIKQVRRYKRRDKKKAANNHFMPGGCSASSRDATTATLTIPVSPRLRRSIQPSFRETINEIKEKLQTTTLTDQVSLCSHPSDCLYHYDMSGGKPPLF